MTKEKRIAIIVILSLIFLEIIGAILVVTIGNKKDNLYAEIWYENKLIEEINLSKIEDLKTKEVKLKDDLYIKIEYKKNAIRVVDAPCHTRECIKTNWISSVNKPIICMDLHYKIILKQANNNVDVII